MMKRVKKILTKNSNALALAAVTIMVVAVGPGYAAGPVDKGYVRSLAAPGKTVLIIEYYDGSGSVAFRKGYASVVGFQAQSGTDIKLDDKVSLHLYGVEACNGEMLNRAEAYSGACDEYAKQQLSIKLRAKVLYCRAFMSEEKAVRQDVTCFGYYYFPGSVDAVDNLEEQLVSIGALRLSRNADGSLMRPDLSEAEKIGRGGFGMWADPRMQDR